ncbi:response regulator [bacterium]|nr:response regulator [bacterium]
MKKKVLIADQALFMRTLLRNVVQKAGYEVCSEARSGKEAIAGFHDHDPHLTILDLVIDEPPGNVVVSEILRINPQAKILIISAISQGILIKKTLEAGTKGYIKKPCNPDKVLTQIRSILEE